MEILVQLFPHYKEGEKNSIVEGLLLVLQQLLTDSSAVDEVELDLQL